MLLTYSVTKAKRALCDVAKKKTSVSMSQCYVINQMVIAIACTIELFDSWEIAKKVTENGHSRTFIHTLLIDLSERIGDDVRSSFWCCLFDLTNHQKRRATCCQINALQWNLACMWRNFGLFCSFSPKLPRVHVGLNCNAKEKKN